jgi:hypothetical protein
MSRTLPPREGDPSPWGTIDSVTPLGPDALAVSTPSHGGIWVSPAALARIPEPLRATTYSGAGWFEEDCDWCIPYLALGLHAFEEPAERRDHVRAVARRTFETWHAAHAGLLEPEAASVEDHQGASHD